MRLDPVHPTLVREEQSVAREELVILIHPTVLSTEKQLYQYQRDYDNVNNVGPRARASVEGAGVLPKRGEYNPDAGRAFMPSEQELRTRPEAPRAVITSPTHRAMRNKRRR